MKTIIALLTLTLLPAAHAATLGQAISQPEGSSLQAFELKNGAVYKKRSNFFDKKKDYELGTYRLAKGESVEAEEKALSKVLAKVAAADEILRKQNTTFNELTKIRPHSSCLLLDDFQIAQGSDLYPELKKIFDTLAAKKWELEDGVKLSSDFRKVTKVKGGQPGEPVPFDFPFACSKNRPPAYCVFKDLGLLYVH
jgi:hypothetical protein